MLANFILQRSSRERAQAMVEFAIVLPILMLLLFGIFEVGRMVFVYSAVTNASREAVRFGSAVGYDDTGIIKYKNCAGIRERARRSAYFLNLTDADITITYDHGPGTAAFHTCTGTVDPGYFIASGDRIRVTVVGQYQPYTLLMPWGARTFTGTSARTILGFVALTANTAVPTQTPVPTATVPTETPTETPVATETPTETRTPPPTVPTSTASATQATSTYTPTPTSLPTNTPLPTWTPTDTPTATPTDTPTSTPTSTPTPTPTP